MHTVIVLAGGFALLLASLLLGHAWGGGMTGAAQGAKYFIPIWLLAAGCNMWLGVALAGYSVSEELPIFLGIFALPAAVAVLLWWKLA